MYQQTRLSDYSAINAPGPLPAVIATWGDAPDLLADLTGHAPKEFGFDGTGFWPVIVTTPAFDPAKQALDGTIKLGAVDPKAKTWAATAGVRDLTADEIAAAYLAANPVPDSVTNYQARQALIDAGLFAQVNAAIEGADQSVKASLEAFQAWEYANNFYRNQPFVMSLGPSFGLSSADIDNLFRAAAKVP